MKDINIINLIENMKNLIKNNINFKKIIFQIKFQKSIRSH